MGGSSKSQTVGYKYYVGMHMIFCHGPIDKIHQIKVDAKIAWSGDLTGGTFYLNNPELFGGESREGGVQGYVDFESGGPTQIQNSYLVSKLGALIPSFRGVAGVVLQKMYVGLNPYLKTWSFKISRIYTRQSGGIAQWYSAKAAIPSPISTISASQTTIIDYSSSGWEYLQVPRSSVTDYSTLTTSPGWPIGTMPFGGEDGGTRANANTFWDIHTYLWLFRIVRTSPGISHTLYIPGSLDDTVQVWWNSVLVFTEADGDALSTPKTIVIPSGSVTGNDILIMKARDRTAVGHPGPGEYTYIDASLYIPSANFTMADMNPAHIIRECLTDPDWGMGYQEADIDDVSFTAAADTLYSESMGISILWESQSSIEEFIKLIVKHIDAALYVNTSTGKFVLKLIRNDYSVGSLITLNEDNIDRITDFSRAQFGELTTSVSVTYWDCVNGTDSTLTVSDSALSQMQNCVISASIQYPGFTNSSIASRVAQRDLKTLSTPLASCTIYANKDASVLTIGSVFKLTWPDYDLTDVVMRVTGIGYGDGKSNRIRLQCVEDVFSTPSTAYIPYTPPAWINPDSPPTPVTVLKVFESPYLELVQVLSQDVIDTKLINDPNIGYIGIGAVRPGSSINARIYTDNGAGYFERVTLDFSPSAQLNGSITQQTTTFPIDNALDLTEVVIGSWAQIDNEIVAITNLSNYSISVKRGCLDTVPEIHADNSPIIFWDNYADGDQIEYVTSDSINVKLCTVTSLGQLPLASAPASNVVMAARAIRPYPPANVKISGVYYPTSLIEVNLTVTWAHRDRLQQTSSILVGYTEASIGPEAGTTYSIRLYNHTSSVLLYSADSLSGTSHSSFPSYTGTYLMRLEIWSVRSGYASFQKFSHIFTLENVTRLVTEVGSTEHIITEAGDLLTTE